MNRARRVVAAAALAGLALGAAGAAADDGFSPAFSAALRGCVGGAVATLEAIETEFPAFRAGEVRMNLGRWRHMLDLARRRSS